MNTEEVLRETLHAAAAHAPTQLVRPPSTAAPRARSRVGFAVAVSTAVTLVAASVVAQAVFDTDEVDGSSVDPASTDTAARLVGMGRAAIEVPDGWQVNHTWCGVPQSNTIIIDPNGSLACQVPRPVGVADIVVDDLNSPTAATWRSVASEPTEVMGEDALTGTANSPLPGYVATVLVVPDLDVIAVGTAPSGESIKEELTAISRIPDTQAVVPMVIGETWLRATERLESLGFTVDIADGDEPRDDQLVRDVSPGPWSILPVGSTVTLATAGFESAN